MLVYITNRTLKKTPKTGVETLSHEQILTKLRKPGNQKDAIYTGIAEGDYQNISFYPKGKEQDLFNTISEEELAKPWVVFLHGFHQDVSETIEKAHKLNKIHGVNVVLFSWPSRPNPIKSFDKKDIKAQIKQYLISTIGYAARPSLVSFASAELKKMLNDYYTNYAPARLNAEASTTDFYAALKLINTHLRPHVKSSQMTMIVHSMGNYLLKRTIADKGDLPLIFKNIICHQADIKASDHSSWIPVLYAYVKQDLYITINKYDVVLGASSVYRLSQKILDIERMGSSTTIRAKRNHQGYINNTVKYIDLTDGRGIENEHEIFTCSGENRDYKGNYNPQEIDQTIVDLLTRILTGKKDGLPKKKGNKAVGFAYMTTIPNIYKPDLIVEDPDLCQWSDEWDCLISSLKAFEDPYKDGVDDGPDPDFDDF